jgi:hypothetical protein
LRADNDLSGIVRKVERLEAENERLKAGSAPAPLDVPTVVERLPAPAPAGNVVPLPKPPSAPVASFDLSSLHGNSLLRN